MTKQKRLLWALLLNPISLIIYAIACRYIATLARFGGVSKRAPIILGTTLILIVWLIYCLVIYRKKTSVFQIQLTQTWQRISNIWLIGAVFIMLGITGATGIHIYKSATQMTSKLAYYLDGIFNTREVEFVHNNVYEDGIVGLFDDINQEVTLPYDMYLVNEFELFFNPDGEITDIYVFLYGYNADNEVETFLINYDSSESNEIRIHLDNYAETNFDEGKRLQPLFETVENTSLEDVVRNWKEDQYGILFAGVRDWGYNKSGIVFVDAEGSLSKLDSVHQRIEEPTVSIYAPLNPDIVPVRIIDYTPETGTSYGEFREEDLFQGFEHSTDGSEFFFLTDDVGYELSVMDAATGSRFYVLNKTEDGAANWDMLNPDPFLGSMGVASGITFIDEQLGFIGMARGGGAHSTLYRTTDGGLTFERLPLPEVEVPLNESEMYNPFDFPHMPYEEDGILYLEVGQGADGDHNEGSRALFQSSNNGETWEFVEKLR